MLSAPLVQSDVEDAFKNVLADISLLARGGQAVVYRARRLQNSLGVETNDPVALKIYLDPDQSERVDREIAVAISMSSDCFCGLLSHGTVYLSSEQYRFLIWAYIEGESLDLFMAKANVHPALAAVIGRDICKAIAEIWAKRIVHRDINPKNIMIRHGLERAVLIDLGVAKHLEQSPLTGIGLTWGTAGYMSPEQMTGMPLTCQSDVFSLGITLQESLTGKHPTNLDQRSLLSGGPPTHTIAPHAPAGLAALIDRMVHARPARRPTPVDLVDTFSDLL
jgi:eukaryotic-like serine/threonine-protein kinase